MTTGAQRDHLPLSSRLAALAALRLAMAGSVLLAVLLAPSLVRIDDDLVAGATAAYLVVSGAAELARRRFPRSARAVLHGALLVDGAYVTAMIALSGGPRSALLFLTSVHVLAATLLASYRTGLKVALWHSLLLVSAYYAARAGLVGTAVPLTAAAFAVSSVWAVAVAAAVFTGLNERELRRSRAGFRALADMARRLEQTEDAREALDILLRSVSDYFNRGRVAVHLRDGDGALLTVLADEAVAASRLPGDQPPDALVARACELRAPVLVRRVEAATDPALASAMPGARNLIAVPLVDESGPLGALVVEHGGMSDATVRPATLELLAQFAAQGALAHRSARLLADVRRLATIDGLTGLANRRAFQQALEREVDRASRRGEPLSLLLVDVDHFKDVNDSYGHQMGDEVLRHVGRVLIRQARTMDTAARYGGEEFAVVLPRCQTAAAYEVAERVRAGISGPDGPLRVTASVGVATLPSGLSDPEWLVEAADAALYQAKADGRDRTVCAGPRQLRTTARRRAMAPGPHRVADGGAGALTADTGQDVGRHAAPAATASADDPGHQPAAAEAPRQVTRVVHANGVVCVAASRVSVGRQLAGEQVTVHVDREAIRIEHEGRLVKAVRRPTPARGPAAGATA